MPFEEVEGDCCHTELLFEHTEVDVLEKERPLVLVTCSEVFRGTKEEEKAEPHEVGYGDGLGGAGGSRGGGCQDQDGLWGGISALRWWIALFPGGNLPLQADVKLPLLVVSGVRGPQYGKPLAHLTGAILCSPSHNLVPFGCEAPVPPLALE
jgi:hypothetical protein